MATFYNVTTIPSPLSIVWCKFPLQEYPNVPGPKSRPALVRSVRFNQDQTKAAVEVTYGTSQIRENEFPHDLIIQNLASLNSCGLPQATRFRLDKTITLPWADNFFQPRDGYATPVIGILDSQSVMQLETLKVLRRQFKK